MKQIVWDRFRVVEGPPREFDPYFFELGCFGVIYRVWCGGGNGPKNWFWDGSGTGRESDFASGNADSAEEAKAAAEANFRAEAAKFIAQGWGD